MHSARAVLQRPSRQRGAHPVAVRADEIDLELGRGARVTRRAQSGNRCRIWLQHLQIQNVAAAQQLGRPSDQLGEGRAELEDREIRAGGANEQRRRPARGHGGEQQVSMQIGANGWPPPPPRRAFQKCEYTTTTACSSTADGAPGAGPSQRGDAAPMTRSKCLLVEDEYLIRLTLAEVLADNGFEVLEAGTADEALDMLQREPEIELLLTDIQLPGSVDGFEVVRRAREGAPSLPVIVMTGRGAPRNAKADAGSNLVFLAKPFLPSELCAAARRLTGR